jgi:phosphomannomutase
MDFKALKSGSDIRGIAIGDGAIFTVAVARQFGAAFTRYIANNKQCNTNCVSVAVGRDSRISGPAILKAVCEGITSVGAKAFDCGMCTTPSMYLAIISSDFLPSASIMITASHHP